MPYVKDGYVRRRKQNLTPNWTGQNRNRPKIGYHIELTHPKLELETSVFGTDADAELHCLVNASLP